ncbi:DUF1254 domain-containing protein [Rhizobium mayense]|uniref:DUF1254 domain-containing protein n=2 Tax=Rhizobium mayense TaxID=1312184 RepID=A0ABT7JZH0_9HYPH|nr:DUF1254 domain-containing protein [Rhizobium mayense]MDL2400583.1 DUF1254 domain-containing protein [Rhizobium mayense]
MYKRIKMGILTALIALLSGAALAQQRQTVPVSVENFIRAESDLYFSATVKKGGMGKFEYNREMTPINNQTVIRMNRDTLYAGAVFDLDAGPVTLTLPESNGRFMSAQIIDEDQYTPQVIYDPGKHVLTKEEIGTRYVLVALRILVDPSKPGDLDEAHRLQDAVDVEQPGGPGKFEARKWDMESQSKIRNALLVLASTLPDTNRAFGRKGEVDPVRRLIAAASAWGGNPDKDAMYLNVTPSKNDGKTIYRLKVKDVPVEGFWSISLYNAKGYFQKNDANAYSLNNKTAKESVDGAVDIQFGGCDGKVPNCLPIVPGWNYMVRLYRPQQSVLDGTWKFPEPEPVK